MFVELCCSSAGSLGTCAALAACWFWMLRLCKNWSIELVSEGLIAPKLTPEVLVFVLVPVPTDVLVPVFVEVFPPPGMTPTPLPPVKVPDIVGIDQTGCGRIEFLLLHRGTLIEGRSFPKKCESSPKSNPKAFLWWASPLACAAVSCSLQS